MRRVIAIDGPSGSGKTTIARLIAKELGIHYLDTGALYRTSALALINHDVKPEDTDDKIQSILDKAKITFMNGRAYLNGRNVSEDIRSTEIDHYASVFSARATVRDFLLSAQRDIALKSELVVEGRDTTTVVFPDATKKIYLDASLEVRAQRRALQFKGKGIHITVEQSKKNIIDRDTRDANRDIAPLKIAPDALIVDSSNQTIEQVLKKILHFIKLDP
jgi:cytidylate kinase